MERRMFIGAFTTGAAAVALGGMTVSIGGCSVLDELETWVPIGLTAFDGIVMLLNPAAGSALAVAIKALDVLWAAVATAISNYQHDTTDPKDTLLEKIVAALNALSTGLDSFLSTFLGGLPPGIQTAVEAGFNLLIATLTSIVSRLGSKTALVGMNHKAAAIHPPQSKAQFIAAYNGISGLQRKIK